MTMPYTYKRGIVAADRKLLLLSLSFRGLK